MNTYQSPWLAQTINRKLYSDAVLLAEYYRWSAVKGFSLCGNEPLTGKPRARVLTYTWQREEARLVHIVQAKFWLNRAKVLRQYAIV